jgi:type II secretory pathway pseudopilin PulG
MKFFTKQETLITLMIFTVLVVVCTPSFILSLRRSRDQIRRDDLGVFQKMVDNYYAKYKEFPKSTSDGKIIICNGAPCIWGQDDFLNFGRIPGDPQSDKGVSYIYLSGPDMYQIFISQEGSDEVEYDQKVINRNINCGNRICNTGRSYNCPVDKSIEECSMMLIYAK